MNANFFCYILCSCYFPDFDIICADYKAAQKLSYYNRNKKGIFENPFPTKVILKYDMCYFLWQSYSKTNVKLTSQTNKKFNTKERQPANVLGLLLDSLPMWYVVSTLNSSNFVFATLPPTMMGQHFHFLSLLRPCHWIGIRTTHNQAREQLDQHRAPNCTNIYLKFHQFELFYNSFFYNF